MVMGSNASDSFRKLGTNQDLSDFVFGGNQITPYLYPPQQR
jgi:hypothetical protein